MQMTEGRLPFFQNMIILMESMDIMKEVVGGFDYKIEENVCYIKLIK